MADSILYLEKSLFLKGPDEAAALAEAKKLQALLVKLSPDFMNELGMNDAQYNYHITHTPFQMEITKALARDPKPKDYDNAVEMKGRHEEKKGAKPR